MKSKKQLIKEYQDETRYENVESLLEVLIDIRDLLIRLEIKLGVEDV